MKALEHLLIEEIAQIRAEESKLHSVYSSLKDATNEQIEAFLAGMLDLDHRASRVERMLEALATPELMAA